MPYRVTLFFGKKPGHDPDSLETVDYHRSSAAEKISAGYMLARLQSLTAAESAPASNSEDDLVIQNKTAIVSENVELAEDDKGQLTVVSKISGFPALVKQQIVVNKKLTIEGDINFHTGNIDCPGDLLIKGSIMAGFKVKAKNLTITGSIENASVECRGNLICAGGIIACHDSPLKCGDNLWCKYLENSRIEVKNNIFIAGSSLHSFLKAGNNIILCHSSAVLVGGKSEAGNSLYSGVLGAKWATPTEIILGCEPFLAQKLDEHKKNLEKLKTELEELHERIEQINTFLQYEEGQTTPHDAHRLQEERELLESKLNYIIHKNKVSQTKLDNLKNQIRAFKKTNFNCTLHISKHLFSGVNLTIKDAETRIEEESPPIVLNVDELQGEIVSK
ncbi:MAG: DUF342 domain-containing protein [Deltaproteobacteria bacterium]|nr:DUF342 domain-containing protein [Candidatus Tharpella sp.]